MRDGTAPALPPEISRSFLRGTSLVLRIFANGKIFHWDEIILCVRAHAYARVTNSASKN